MSPRRFSFTALAAAALLAAGCASTTSGSVATDGRGRSQLLLVSQEQVVQQSLQYYDQQNQKARAQGKLVTSGAEWSRVNAVMQRLVPQVAAFRPDAARWPWQLVLIDEDTINAHVMAGGKITFYTGILRKLRLTDDEIAAIMGHEMAHALREHTREKMSQSAAGDVALALGGALLGVGEGAVQLAGLGKQLALDLPFSRNMESEADLYGLELAARAGYDPRAAITLWEKMAQAGGSGGPSFLSTHPNAGNRMAALQAAMPRVMPIYEQARARR
ncbi:M48 family metallopeptidase [Ottowia sp. SB7-C50]|uniref:M48 family metallopeptidase n=1 Tax=Ottowia sp. SB7-C50 TaxID=3081231 RepID=UPI00295518E6|nr:M48 family metallopeptidase [Ottowia sp. SB7-C50]WOP15702.1 M48 family metallopeptidase [Ottowia sp. SB7-C50]